MSKLKSYRSFGEFERQELLRKDSLYSSIDDIVDELFLQGLDARPVRRSGGGWGGGSGSDGSLFDDE
jgi:hypothetical protein